MINILKNTTSKDVQTHIDKAYEIIDEWLPKYYVDLVIKKLHNSTVSKIIINNVRNKKSFRIDVVNALVEVALDNKLQIEKFQKLIS